VGSGIDSALAYELWLETGDAAHLDAIAEYNEDDCVSTLELRDWLEERRLEAETQHGAILRPQPGVDNRSENSIERDEAAKALERALTMATASASQASDALVLETTRDLIGFHGREQAVVWWEWFDRTQMTSQQLLDDSTALAGLEFVGQGQWKRSHSWTYRFPEQHFKLRLGETVRDPQLGLEAPAGGVVREIDFESQLITLSRGQANTRIDPVHPSALVPEPTDRSQPLRDAIDWLSGQLRSGGTAMLADKAPATASLLAGAQAGGSSTQTGSDAARERSLQLNGDYLAIQGPPGTGKTWTAAQIICDLAMRGRTVGISAHSHAVIENLLNAVLVAKADRGLDFGLARKVRAEAEPIDGVEYFTQNRSLDRWIAGQRGAVVGATPYYWARLHKQEVQEEHEVSVDTLIIDEAGQMSLANATAASTAARNVILVGDPQQLDQPLRGVHPETVDRSVLRHLLGDAAVVSEDQGVFLPATRRMHPDVTNYVSEQFYEGQLNSFEDCSNQALDPAGTGLRFVPMSHRGRVSRSPEEVLAVRGLVKYLIGQTWTERDGSKRPIEEEDILVITPFNAQVAALRADLGDRVQVGTVDMFQGREAPVTIYSMVCSDTSLAPRGMAFLYSTNRLNVAVSRSQGTCFVVANEVLMTPACRTADEVRLASAFTRLVEIADVRDNRGRQPVSKAEQSCGSGAQSARELGESNV
jgi:uncharacterized protein